jgi:hypothetical protein
MNNQNNKIYTVFTKFGSGLLTEFWISLKEHYILIFSFSALVCSAIGFWSEHTLLKEFNLNIVLFAEIDDFFLAGLKRPIIFIAAFAGFVAGTTCILLLAAKNDEKEDISDEKISLRRAIIWIGGFIITSMLIIAHIEIQESVKKIRENPVIMATVQLRSKLAIPNQSNAPLVFITATNKFIFFYQRHTKEELSTFVVPVSSILYVRYANFKKGNGDINSN